jgi:hypothetical protein
MSLDCRGNEVRATLTKLDKQQQQQQQQQHSLLSQASWGATLTWKLDKQKKEI